MTSLILKPCAIIVERKSLFLKPVFKTLLFFLFFFHLLIQILKAVGLRVSADTGKERH